MAMLAATELSTKILFPVPSKRLMVLLPVLAVNRYFPILVIQHGATWPAPIIDVNAPSRNSPCLDRIGSSSLRRWVYSSD